MYTNWYDGFNDSICRAYIGADTIMLMIPKNNDPISEVQKKIREALRNSS